MRTGFKTSFFAKVFLILIVSQQMISLSNAEAIGPTGMSLRIAQKQVEQFKKAMEYFLPHYLALDAKLPEEYTWHMKLFFTLIDIPIEFKKINYKPPDLDIRDT
jgi:hypothetical protein